jgi:amino acid permease
MASKDAELNLIQRGASVNDDEPIIEEEDQEDHGKSSAHRSGTVGGAFNTANTILGAGVIALPYIMKCFGMIFGIILVCFMAMVTVLTIHLLMEAKDSTGKNTYGKIAEASLGAKGSIITKCAIILNNYGLCTVYLVIFGSLFPSILLELGAGATASDRRIWMSVLAVLLIPCIFNKSMGILRYASATGVVAITVFTIVLVIKLGETGGKGGARVLYPNASAADMLSSFPDLFLAYTFHYNIFPIYNSLEDKTNRGMMKAGSLGLLISTIVFNTIGIVGYLMFGNDV